MNWTSHLTGLLSEFKNGSGKNLFHNFLSLSFLQISNYLLPLIILPYLIRVVGIEKFGLIAFAQGVMQYFIILTDYGFNLSATKEISSNRDNENIISEIFCSVLIIKFILTLIALGVLYLIIATTDKFGADAVLYIFTFGLVIGNLLFPVWFFQGIEKMKHLTALHLIGKIFYLITLFIFVKDTANYLYVPLLNSIGLILSGLIAIIVIVFKFKVKLIIPSLKSIIGHFRESSQFFLSRVSVSLYTSINTVVLGFFTSNEMVGFYSAAEKIFIAMRSAFAPIAQALYPYMAHKLNLGLFKKLYYLVLALAVIIGVSIYLFSGDIIRIAFGPNLELSAEILRIFAITLPLAATSIMLGYPLLAAFGYKNSVNVPLMIASILHIVLIASIIPVIDPVKVAMVSLVTETAVVSMLIQQIRKYNIWHLTPKTSD
ncbi:MAG: oligosaccharide flippase family protein [Candidatus Zixiibacteriota bacterium]